MTNDILTLAAEIIDDKRNGCIIALDETDGVLKVKASIHGERWQIYFLAMCLIDFAANKFGEDPTVIAKALANRFADGSFKKCEIQEG